MKLTNERGSTIPLIIFFCFIGLTVAAVVAAATSLYIERKRLFTLADGAALAATEQFTWQQVDYSNGALHIQLFDADVAQAARAYIASAVTMVDDATLVSANSPDGQSARVTVASTWHPPVLGELIPWSLPLDVTATARTAFR